MYQSEICYFRRFQLQLELVCDEGDKFRIGGFPLGIADRITEEPLEGVQIASVPGHFDGMADGTLYPGRGGLEGLRHLGVQDFRDGIDHIHVVHGDDNGLPQILVTLDVGRNAGRFIEQFVA